MCGLIVVLMHAVTGTLDASFRWIDWAPAPASPGWLFMAGVVGVVSLASILVAVALVIKLSVGLSGVSSERFAQSARVRGSRRRERCRADGP